MPSNPASTETSREFLEDLLNRLREDDITVLQDFLAWQGRAQEFFGKVEGAHEFLDQLTFKIKESRSRMSKDTLTQFSLDFLRDTFAAYGYNPKFVAVQCKALITYHQNQKNLAKAIEVCEFLIENGITDDDAKGFHVRLDAFHRLKKRVDERGGDLSGIRFEPLEDEEEDEPVDEKD
ncbi:MAG TPA: hypothetical protein VHO02_00560 [Fibrobacteria bacterium]|nr:hypothetical protein [Fibrobacteria bacterium]